MIKKIPYQKLNTEKYTKCVSQAVQRNIYASLSLMKIANGAQWDILVYEDYKAVMPVPFVYKMGMKIVTKPWTIQQLGVFSEEDSPELNARFREFLLKEYIVHFYPFNEDNEFENYDEKFQNFSIKKNNYQEVKAAYSSHRRRNVRVKSEKNICFEVVKNIDSVKDFYLNHIKGGINAKNKEIFYNILKECFVDNLLRIYQLKINEQLASLAMVLQSEEMICTTILLNEPRFMKENTSSILIDQILQRHIENQNLSFSGSNIPAIADFYERFGGIKKYYNTVSFSKKQVILQIAQKKLHLPFGRI